ALAVAEEQAALDDVLELADVAGPGMPEEALHRAVGHPAHVLLELGAEVAEEVLDQERDVALALAQRRQAHLDHVEPVVEVLAEAALPDLLQQIAVGRRDQPYVDLDGLDAAHPLELLLLDRAEQLHLHVDRDLADLVEEERAV